MALGVREAEGSLEARRGIGICYDGSDGDYEMNETRLTDLLIWIWFINKLFEMKEEEKSKHL